MFSLALLFLVSDRAPIYPSLSYTDMSLAFVVVLEAGFNCLSPWRSMLKPASEGRSVKFRPARGRGPSFGGPKSGVCIYAPWSPRPRSRFWLLSCSPCLGRPSPLLSTSATTPQDEEGDTRGEICCWGWLATS